MSLTYGILGLLKYKDNTGYDLAKLFNDSLKFFWDARTSQIYRELNRMEKTGLLSSRTVVQEGKPNRRVYSITSEGEAEFTRWLRDFHFSMENHHHAILMRLFFSDEIEMEATKVLLRECSEQCKSMVRILENIVKANSIAISEQVEMGKRKKLYWDMAISFGITQHKSMIRWAEDCIKKMESR